MRAPAALVAVPLLAGCAAGLLTYGVADHLPIAAAGGALLALLAGLSARGQPGGADCATAIVAGSLLAGVSLGADAARRAYDPPLLAWFESRAESPADPLVVEGVLREDAAPGAFGISLTVDVRRIGRGAAMSAAPGGVRLSVAGTLAGERLTEWRQGRAVRVSATLREPAVYRNPGVGDDRRALARRGIVLVGSVKSGALVETTALGSRGSETAGMCRAWVRERLAESIGIWSRRSAAIAAAILIGDRSGLAEDDQRRLQEAGTYHVIAISGGNIAILTLVLMGLTRALRLPSRLAPALIIVVLLFYGRVVAPAASVDRAVTAAVVYLAGRLFDQSGPASNVLAVAAAIALAAWPLTVMDPGFILSFGATLGILVIVPALLAWGRGGPRLLRGGLTLLAATVAAELALAPVGAALFGRITFAGLLLNFAAIPLMTAVQVGALAVLALWALEPAAARMVGYGVHLAATGLVESARLVDVAPWLWRNASPAAWWLVILYYGALGVALSRSRYARRAAIAAALAGGVMLMGPGPAVRDRMPGPPAGWLRVAFLDVGQGDATLVRLPDGRAFLIDAGGLPAAPVQPEAPEGTAVGFDVGERVVSPALRALGVRHLDTLIITHPHPDHIGGAPAVLRRFGPRAIWEGVPVPPDPALRALAGAAARAGIEWRTVQTGDAVRVAGIDLRILHPPPPDWERQRTRNDDSVVLEIRYGDVAVILPGDIEREGESAVLRHISRGPLVVLKAPHHGSATSSTPELLDALQPDAVVFSAGRHNLFGHPAPVVIARYRARGSVVFSTAEDGAVILDTDGRVVEIAGFTGRKVTLKGSR